MSIIRITSKGFKNRRLRNKRRKRYIGKLAHFADTYESGEIFRKSLETLDLLRLLQKTRKQNSKLVKATVSLEDYK